MSDAAVESLILPDPEDQKLITLARATLARNGSSQGASVRDNDGRVYAAARVELEHLTLSAVCRGRGDGCLIRSDRARGRGGGGYASLRAGLRRATRPVGLQCWRLVGGFCRQDSRGEPAVTASPGYVSRHSRRNDPCSTLPRGRCAAQASR